MMNEDLHEALPLWSLDRRGDGPRRTATTRGVVGVSSPLFVRPVPLGTPDPQGWFAMRPRDGHRRRMCKQGPVNASQFAFRPRQQMVATPSRKYSRVLATAPRFTFTKKRTSTSSSWRNGVRLVSG